MNGIWNELLYALAAQLVLDGGQMLYDTGIHVQTYGPMGLCARLNRAQTNGFENGWLYVQMNYRQGKELISGMIRWLVSFNKYLIDRDLIERKTWENVISEEMKER